MPEDDPCTYHDIEGVLGPELGDLQALVAQIHHTLQDGNALLYAQQIRRLKSGRSPGQQLEVLLRFKGSDGSVQSMKASPRRRSNRPLSMASSTPSEPITEKLTSSNAAALARSPSMAI